MLKGVKENPDKIYWSQLSNNPNAIDLLKENPDKIYWSQLSLNSSIDAIQLLKKIPIKFIGLPCLSIQTR